MMNEEIITLLPKRKKGIWKIVFSRFALVLFLCRNQSSPNVLKIYGEQFWKISKISAPSSTSGGGPVGHKPLLRHHPPVAVGRLVGPTGTPSTHSCSHLVLLPPEKIVSQLKPVFLLLLLGFSISLLKSPFSELFRGNYSLVSDSSIGPISFCSSALYIAYFCCLGDHVLELCMLILASPK